MKDRIPTYPGRVTLTPVSGNTYDLERADEPTEAGTPLNKNTFLKDATAALFGLTDAVPDDVFAAIASGRAKVETGTYTGTGVYGSGNQNSITFSITPKIVIIARQSTIYGFPMVIPYIWGEKNFYTGNLSTYREQVVTLNGNTMQWYSNGGNSDYQLNDSGKVYTWAAIG